MTDKEKKLNTLIASAMCFLEDIEDISMTCGRIGSGGATVKELNQAYEEGRYVDGDATIHTAQMAWRILEKARGLL